MGSLVVLTSLRQCGTQLRGGRGASGVFPQASGLLDHFFLADTGDVFRDAGISGGDAPTAMCRRLDFLINGFRGPGRDAADFRQPSQLL